MRPARAGLVDDLINAGRTIALFGRIVEPIIDRDRLLRIAEPQMRRLVLLVIGIRDEDRRKAVEGDFAIGSRIVDAPRLAGFGQLQMVRMVVKRPRRIAAKDISVERRISETAPQTPAKAWPDVADPAQFLPDPGLFESGPDLCAELSRQSAEDSFCRDHSGLHRGVAALDFRHVDEPGGVPDQRAAREIKPRDRLIAALVERARAIGDPAAPFEIGEDRRMGLEALELLERVEKRVLVVETDYKPGRHVPILEVIEKGAAISRRV